MIKWFAFFTLLNFSVALAEKVDVEIAFLVDTSGSVSNAQLNIQRESIRNALKSERVLRIISDNYNMKIAIGYFEFSDKSGMIGKWTIVSTAADMDNFINSFPDQRFSDGGTLTYNGIMYTIESIFKNNIDSVTQNIMLFTDGITENERYAKYILDQTYKNVPNSLSIAGVILSYSQLYSETTDEWMRNDIVRGSKPYIMSFSHENVEYIISKMLEIETQ